MSVRTSVLALLLLVALAPSGQAQGVIEGTEELSFDRPEAWAMKYFAAVTLLTGLGPPAPREAGAVALACELGTIPHLDEDQRRVGFGGTTGEDLNKLQARGRLRGTVGLGRDWSLDAAWVPPVEIKGVTANIFSLGIERPFLRSGRWTLGVRAYGQIGETKGDYTCTADEAGFEPGSPENEFGCEEASDDTVTMDYLGAAFTGGYQTSPRGAIHFGVGGNYMDLAFQVNALTYGVRDRTLLVTDGWTFSLNAGYSTDLGKKTGLGVELFYSPLEVQRTIDGSSENDPLLNLRAIFRYRL